LLHVLWSLPNTNPVLQEHTCHSFLLLQIWLHPPLFGLSQGCTKIKGKIVSASRNQYIYYTSWFCVQIELFRSPFLQVLPSFANTNPVWQEHWCFSIILLQIWLHPPLFAASQACTIKMKMINLKNIFLALSINHHLYWSNIHTSVQ